MQLKTLITDFLEHLEVEKNKSQLTIQNYDHYLRRFLGWGKKNNLIKPEQITLDKIRKYRLFLHRLKNQQGDYLKQNTQNYHVIALRAFLKYLAKRDIKTLAPEKIELAKDQKRQVEFLDAEEVGRLLETPDTKTEKGLRDRAILELLFSTGLRVGELTKLTRDQVNLERGEFAVRGKGDKLRVVFLSASTIHWLKEYFKKRGDKTKSIFTTTKQGDDISRVPSNLTPRSIQRIVKNNSLKAGIVKKVTPHTLRHSFATDLLINGADIRSVQALLGHANITTTQVYTHVTDKQLREVHQAFHGKRK
ncbi:site-specific tyrosine recombinase/integron integrase [Patescibacteria group bacterium]